MKSIKFFIAIIAAIVTITLIGFIGDSFIPEKELTKDAVIIEVAAAAIETVTEKTEITKTTSNDITPAPEVAADAPKSFNDLLASADISKGKKVARSCGACHAIKKNGPHITGPNLWGIVGSEVASKSGFKYSKGMQEAGGVWDYNALNQFMLSPKEYVSGTKMMYRGLKKIEDRAALIAWLRMQADEPQPLPNE